MKKLIYIISLALVITSCTKEVDIELNNEENSRLVVDGGITTETKAHQIVLTRTTSYFANQAAPRETGATVTITDGTNTFVLAEKAPGVYKTDSTVFGVIGKTYTLNIKLLNGEEYSSTATITKVALMDSVVADYVPKTSYDEAGYDLLLFAQEPTGVGDYYMFNVYRNDTLDNDTVRKTSFSEDAMYDGMYLPGISVYWLDETSVKSDSTHIKVDMLSISKSYFDYLMALMLETDYRGSMFDGPPANIPTNISNGALGFFEASAISSYEFDIIKEKK